MKHILNLLILTIIAGSTALAEPHWASKSTAKVVAVTEEWNSSKIITPAASPSLSGFIGHAAATNADGQFHVALTGGAFGQPQTSTVVITKVYHLTLDDGRKIDSAQRYSIGDVFKSTK